MKPYDLIVIGGGSGGMTAASGAAQFGASVALIDNKANLGGDCLHYGCIPSKALITAAKEIHDAERTAAEFNMTLEGRVDFQHIAERVTRAVQDMQKMDDAERFRELGVDVFTDTAHFAGKHDVALSNGSVIQGKRIVIATGSRPVIPSIEGLENISFLTNETVFDLDELPERIVCAGAGPVGTELAQALSRLGSEVVLVDPSHRMFPEEDHHMAEITQLSLEKELTFLPEARVHRVEKEGEKTFVIVKKEEQGEQWNIEADALLLAAGRRPNTEELHLEKAGLKAEKDGHIHTTRALKTVQPHIYAVGDVTGVYAYTQAAGMEGRVVVANAVFGLSRKVNYANMPWAYYTDPELFHLGITEEEAKRQGEDVYIYSAGAQDVDRFIAERRFVGCAKIITDKKGRVLGAHAVGRQAVDWMQEVTAAKTWKKPLRAFSGVLYPYPSRGEIVRHAADAYWREKLFSGTWTKWMKRYVQWFR